jgi:acetylornithine/N-succinyldiaminopimelate aminotransferase
MIADEIQSGYGRTGKFFAHQHAGVTPDLITMAKGMGNGFPVGGVLIAPRFIATHGMLGTTFGGSYLACTAAIAVLDILKQDDLMQNAAALGTYISQGLAGLPGIKEIRGEGLMIGIELKFDCSEVRKKLLYDHHIFTGASGKYTLRILPPLNLSTADADLFIKEFSHVLSQYTQSA